MTAATVLLGAAVVAMAAAVSAYVLRPLFRGAEILEDADPRAVALLAEREAVLATLRDLDADHADHRLGDEDYQRLRADVVARGAAVLAALDQVAAENTGRTEAITADLEAEIAAAGDGAGASSGADRSASGHCTHCGHPRRPADRYCGGCGRSFDNGPEFTE